MTTYRPPRERSALRTEQLRPHLDPAGLPFSSTADVPPLDTLLGQQDALDALAFGIEASGPGLNLYVAGDSGSGKTTTVLAHLRAAAAARAAPPDWVFVHDFAAPDRPLALSLPSGRAADVAREMVAFARDAERAIRRTFESEEHEHRRRAALDDVAGRRREVLAGAAAVGQAQGFRVDYALGRLTSTPLVEGESITEEQFAALTPEARADLAARTEGFEQEMQAVVRQLRQVEREEDERGQNFDRAAMQATIEPLLVELKSHYAEVPPLLEHLARVGGDIVDRARSFIPSEPAEDDDEAGAADHDEGHGAEGSRTSFRRYAINVFIDHAGAGGAPVVVEAHPTAENLTGRMDYRVTANGLVTDFLQVRPGSLHRANGGFLVVRADDLLQTEDAWSVLKRALIGGEVRLEGGGDDSPLPTIALRPAAIPLDVKVVLVGTEECYQMLFDLDPDFRELFKVKVEFAPDLPWSDEAVRLYAGFLSRCVVDRKLRPLGADAIARAVEIGARLCGRQGRLSTRLGDLADTVTEASFWAGKAGREQVVAADVDRAVRSRRARSGLLERSLQAAIAHHAVLVETSGRQVGQVNALMVVESGDARFGVPARVTATVGPGDGVVCSIEREVALAGPIHAKGVLTLRGYLTRMFGGDEPLSLAATIAFEQSYGPIEGDSASLAELLALLSALAEVPLDQGVAVTGSVDQRGQLQPIGEVNAKIEGFFFACREAGLTGDQGVVIPLSNAVHLVLDDEVVEAVREGRFHVWAAATVDDALAILTGDEVGAPAVDGTFPPAGIYGRAAARLRRYTRQLATSGRGAPSLRRRR